MQKRHPPRAAIVGGAIALIVVAYYGVRALAASRNGELKASGTIEAVTVTISPELGGRVEAVRVGEGDAVHSGQALLVMDDTLMQEQRRVAAAGLELAKATSQTAHNALDIAQAQYQQTLEAALAEGKATRLQDWFAKNELQFDQPNWYFSRAEQIQALQAHVDQAKKAWDEANTQLITVTHALGAADFLAAEERVLAARVSYMVKKDVNERAQNSTDVDAPLGRYNKAHCGTNEGYRLATGRLTNEIYGCTGDEHLSEVSQREYDAAQVELTSAQRAYSELLTTRAADDVLAARADVAVAQERYYAALDRLRALQSGDFAPSVTTAQGVVDQAQAAFEQSQQAVSQAQANLGLVDAQLAKLTLFAPVDGVVLTRSVEPGEFGQAGAPALILGDLSQLTITVYVPEDRYGQISLGQQASLSVDSFPGMTFAAQVTHVADEAEFTPRNVQTVEGRSATVYAIKLTVNDPEGKLRPGMPADVDFLQ